MIARKIFKPNNGFPRNNFESQIRTYGQEHFGFGPSPWHFLLQKKNVHDQSAVLIRRNSGCLFVRNDRSLLDYLTTSDLDEKLDDLDSV